MSIINIRALLENKLNVITPSLATVWENTPYNPIAGTPYQQVYLLPAEPSNPTMGDGFYREQGLFQITLMYPLQKGSASAAARAELIRTAFKRGQSIAITVDGYILNEDGSYLLDEDGNRIIIEDSSPITVRIDKTPEVSQGRVDGDRWALPVKVRWFADNLS